MVLLRSPCFLPNPVSLYRSGMRVLLPVYLSGARNALC